MNRIVGKGLLLAVFVSLLCGCVPIPYKELHAPRIRGVLQSGDMPLVNTNVYLSAAEGRKDCDNYNIVTKTNDSGEFEIGPVKESHFVIWLVAIGDPYASWDLCVEVDGKRNEILGQRGIGFSVETLLVKCNVATDREIDIEFDAWPKVFGRCELIHNHTLKRDAAESRRAP
jgi:hypothetical protein